LFVGVINSAVNSYDNVEQTFLALQDEEGNNPHGIWKQNSFGYLTMTFPSKCSNFVIRNYLFKGELPIKGIKCETDRPLFS
jgi:hypothetical protein